MPRTSKAQAPVVMENEVLTSRHVELDDFTVVFEILAVLGANMAAAGALA